MRRSQTQRSRPGRQARHGGLLLPGAVGVEDVEGEVRHAGGEAQARGVGGRPAEVRLAAAVAAPAQGATQQRGGCNKPVNQNRNQNLPEQREALLTFAGRRLGDVLPGWGGGGWVGSVQGAVSGLGLQVPAVGREHQVQGGQLQHALHPGHGQAAEADLGGLEADATR